MLKGMKREAILLFPQVLIYRQGAGGPQPGTLQKAGALSLWGGTGIFLSQGE